MKVTRMEKSSNFTTVIYDFDGTLCLNDSFKVYLFRSLFFNPGQWWKVPIVATLTIASLVFRVVSNDLLKKLILRLTCKNLERYQAENHAQSLMSKLRWDKELLKHFKSSKEDNKLTILATASPEIYVSHIAKKLGFDLVVCTKMYRDSNGKWSGETLSPNCVGKQKAVRLTELLREESISWRECIFISDSHVDMPSFEMAGRSYAVRPSIRLARKMSEMGILPFSCCKY